MPTFGGMQPFPRKFGGGKPRLEFILESLNADRGTAYDASNRETTVYVENMAIARAINATWGTNQRLANLWVPFRMSSDTLSRWETILDVKAHGYAAANEYERRERVEEVLHHMGHATAIRAHLESDVRAAVGDAYVDVEYIPYASALITVPDGTYPWGSVLAGAPWSSSVAKVLIRLQRTSQMTEQEFYTAAAQIPLSLEHSLPSWATADWYRAGPISVSIAGGPSAAGFYLDDDHNLDNEIFDV